MSPLYFLRSLWLCAALACCTLTASAQMQPLSEEELSNTRGQGLVALTNTSLGGFDFSKVALDADITLSANLRNMRLGEYTYAARNGTGADLDIGLLQFGRSDGTEAQRLVHISNPYFEFVYKNAADGASREAVGMRFGFEGISGDIGLKINSLSGSMKVSGLAADGSAVQLDTHTDTLGGKRWDGGCTAPCLSLAQLGGVTAGDAAGPSRDFWISVLKTGVQFPSAAGVPASDPAQAGIWLNWRDKLQALNTTGLVPPNLPKGR
ncbi:MULTISPECIES: hypothetical protein [unclassified Duganella]|uniref:hypothetical protein n=1 Tax=unclassified Duganella TaxID=2636909 RepID=UPI000E346F3F|nr:MULTISPECIES: hypothetical protein [unclassified Duganella]RFP08652.1 hypothetical protein D0T23_28465 [Duganella sp. BJB475]RFP27494.1 hypothetical protein D0T21_22290 [Duganella sp. BJB476]